MLNNYTEEEFENIKRVLEDKCKFAIVGKEVGENGTPHLQGFFNLIEKKRFKFRKPKGLN